MPKTPPPVPTNPEDLLAFAEEISDQTLMERLNIRWLEVSADRVVAAMPVDGNIQPFGALHGGATAALIESVASLGATVAAAPSVAIGVDMTVHHLRSVRDGVVTAVGTPLHHGTTTSVWNVAVHDDAGNAVAAGRCTLLLREPPA